MRRIVTAAVALIALLPLEAAAATRTVAVADNSFTPATVTVRPGDTVRWEKGSTLNPHNVSEGRGFFRSGDPTTAAFTYDRMPSAGTFAFFCEVHGSMTGTVRVPPRITAGPAGPAFTVRWATAGTNTGNRADVQFRVGSGKWRTWLSNTTADKAAFGKNAKPVRVRAGKRYSFRARSQRGSTHSGWSPLASRRT